MWLIPYIPPRSPRAHRGRGRPWTTELLSSELSNSRIGPKVRSSALPPPRNIFVPSSADYEYQYAEYDHNGDDHDRDLTRQSFVSQLHGPELSTRQYSQ